MLSSFWKRWSLQPSPSKPDTMIKPLPKSIEPFPSTLLTEHLVIVASFLENAEEVLEECNVTITPAIGAYLDDCLPHTRAAIAYTDSTSYPNVKASFGTFSHTRHIHTTSVSEYNFSDWHPSLSVNGVSNIHIKSEHATHASLIIGGQQVTYIHLSTHEGPIFDIAIPLMTFHSVVIRADGPFILNYDLVRFDNVVDRVDVWYNYYFHCHSNRDGKFEKPNGCVSSIRAINSTYNGRRLFINLDNGRFVFPMKKDEVGWYIEFRNPIWFHNVTSVRLLTSEEFGEGFEIIASCRNIMTAMCGMIGICYSV